MFTTGRGLVTWRGSVNVRKRGIKRSLCPAVNKEAMMTIMEDQKRGRGYLLARSAVLGNKLAIQMGTIGKSADIARGIGCRG